MKFGLGYANTIPFTDPGPALELARAAESSGFDSIWTVEHVIWPHAYDSTYPYHPSGKMPGNPSIPIPDPLIWLTWVAAATSRLGLVTGVMILPLRNPLILAKEVATLDHLSGGRFSLGVGVGWLEEEFDALGVEFTGRGRRTDEMLEMMQTLWGEDLASYAGIEHAFDDVALNPKPLKGRVPIVVGGNSRAATRRAARYGDGFYPGPDSMEALDRSLLMLAEECAEIDRDPASIEISAAFPGRFMSDPAGAVAAMAEVGVDRIIVPSFEVTRPGVAEGMSRFTDAISDILCT